MKKLFTLGVAFLFCHFAISQMSNEDFGKIVNAAIKAMDLPAPNTSKVKNFKPIKSIKQDPLGTWNIVLTNHGPNEADNTVNLYDANVTIKKEGDTYTFHSASQTLNPLFASSILERKYVAMPQNVLRKKLKGATVSFDGNDNRVNLHGKGSLTDKEGSIINDMKHMLNFSFGIIHNARYEEFNEENERKEAFKKSKILEMPKGSLPFYLNAKWLYKFEKDNDEALNGYYTFSNKKLNLSFKMYNKQDKLDYLIYRKLDENIAKSNAEALKNKMDEYLVKNGLREATSTETYLEGNYYGIRITYNYDGSIKGQTLIDSFAKTQNGYREKLSKQIDEILASLN